MTDWDAELRKIDRQMESMSDKALIPSAPAGAPPAAVASVAAQRESTRTWPALLRLALAGALGVGILFWPYDTRCGFGMGGYLAAIGVLTIAGAWSAVWTWRHRTARAHMLSLLLVGWGLILAGVEVLPRMGYARADALRPVGWSCAAIPPTTVRTPVPLVAP